MKDVYGPQERRDLYRVLHDARSTAFAPGRDPPCQRHDVSLQGQRLEGRSDGQLGPGQGDRISIRPARNVEIAMDARPIDQNGRHTGFQWVYIDLDSATDLRRLAALNHGGPARLQRHFHALLPDL